MKTSSAPNSSYGKAFPSKLTVDFLKCLTSIGAAKNQPFDTLSCLRIPYDAKGSATTCSSQNLKQLMRQLHFRAKKFLWNPRMRPVAHQERVLTKDCSHREK